MDTEPVVTTNPLAPTPTTTGAPAGTQPPSPTTTSEVDTGDIEGYRLASVELNGEELLVAVADDSDLRARGLMGVEEFGELDGMVFVWDEFRTGSFWMWTVPIALEIAFFDGDGLLVDVLRMEPCMEGPSEDCPRYSPSGGYVYALETPVGGLINLEAGSVLSVASLKK